MVQSSRKRNGWTHETRAFRKWSDPEIVETAAIAVSGRRQRRALPHAYTDLELRRFLAVVKPIKVIPIAKLHRYLDLFAICVGVFIHGERIISIADRKDDVKKAFIGPAEKLLSNLLHHDRRKELDALWSGFRESGFRGVKRKRFVRDLEEFIDAARRHLEKLDGRSVKGERWDAGLKRYHVKMTAHLLDHLHVNFGTESRRTAADLHAAAEILSIALFDPKPELKAVVRKMLKENRG